MSVTGRSYCALAKGRMVAIIAVALLLADPAGAQGPPGSEIHQAAAQVEPDTAFTFPAYGGLGIAVFSHLGGAATGGVSVRKSGHVVTGRTTAAVTFNGTSVIDVGVLYGRMFSTENSTFSVGAGLGVVGGVAAEGGGLLSGTGPTRETRETVVGLPIEFQVEHGGAIGINLVLFGNVNSQEPYGGAALALRVGRLLNDREG